MDEPALLSLAIWPKTDAGRARLTEGLRKLMAEDSALRLKDGPLPGEVVIAATGELQLELVLHRLKREFNIEASVGRPQVAYKETFTRPADGEMKYAKQTDGRGEFDHYQPVQGAEDGGSQDAFVPAPQRPSPTPRSSGVALPEPEDSR